MSATTIEVDARRVLAAGITPGRCAIWALQKRRDGKPDQALRLLEAAATLIRQEARHSAGRSTALGGA
jgi:hypothetical protein